jgi:glycosyl transferase family 25
MSLNTNNTIDLTVNTDKIPLFQFTAKNTFCISLEKSKDRWDFMKKQFEYFNMDLQRWNASNGNTLTDRFVHYLSDSQKGCSQSHINIYRHIIENNLDYALILEDDACFDFSWKTKLDKFNKEITEEQYTNLNIVLLNASEPMDELNKWELVTEQYLTGGYIITKKGASLILDIFKDCYYASDWMTTRLQNIYNNCYSFYPWLVIQKGGNSTIQPNGSCDADREKVIYCLKNIDYSIKDNYYMGNTISTH